MWVRCLYHITQHLQTELAHKVALDQVWMTLTLEILPPARLLNTFIFCMVLSVNLCNLHSCLGVSSVEQHRALALMHKGCDAAGTRCPLKNIDDCKRCQSKSLELKNPKYPKDMITIYHNELLDRSRASYESSSWTCETNKKNQRRRSPDQ